MPNSRLTELEEESVFVFRELAAEFKNIMLLFSGGKDSAVALHIAKKALFPAKLPFGLLHIDSGRDFPETVKFINRCAVSNEIPVKRVSVTDYLNKNRSNLSEKLQSNINRLQSFALKECLEQEKYDLLIGGARRDEEKARAKERFFSLRGIDGAWNPENQRSEIWRLFNYNLKASEHMRCFPLNNWSELDVWKYIKEENIEIPNIYFAHQRICWINKHLQLVADSPHLNTEGWNLIGERTVRCRTVGDMTCTGLIESNAKTVDEIITEISCSEVSERSSRIDDKFSRSAMEERKAEGYF